MILIDSHIRTGLNYDVLEKIDVKCPSKIHCRFEQKNYQPVLLKSWYCLEKFSLCSLNKARKLFSSKQPESQKFLLNSKDSDRFYEILNRAVGASQNQGGQHCQTYFGL